MSPRAISASWRTKLLMRSVHFIASIRISLVRAVLRAVLQSVPAFAAAGCSLISGDKAVPAVGDDRSTAFLANESLTGKIPVMTHATSGRALFLYKVAFDGTMNDAARVPVDERPTIVAHIRDLTGAHYYAGPGMQEPHSISVRDAAIGYTSAPTAERAERDFFAELSSQVAANPNSEIRVFVTGFSRGAATARHFMNIVTRDWANCAGCTASNRPEFFAILYDTVATFQMELLQLSLPPTVNFLIHVVAADEPRIDFRPLIDVESDDALVAESEGGNRFESARIHLLVLPGAHSDVGASYRAGVGDAYRSMSEMWLHSMGLIKQSCFELNNDPFVAGKHDSRGRLDALILTAAPNSSDSVSRTAYRERTQTLDESARQEMIARLNELESAESEVGGMMISRREQPPLRMVLLRQGRNISLVSLNSADFDAASFKFEVVKGRRQISLRSSPPYSDRLTLIDLDDNIWRRLHDGAASQLSYGLYNDRQGGIHIAIDVDGVLVSADQWHDESGKDVPHVQDQCVRDSDGTLVPPIKVFILHSDDGTP